MELIFAWFKAWFNAQTSIRKQNIKIATLKKDINWILRYLEVEIEGAAEEITTKKRSTKKAASNGHDFTGWTDQELYDWAKEHEHSNLEEEEVSA